MKTAYKIYRCFIITKREKQLLKNIWFLFGVSLVLLLSFVSCLHLNKVKYEKYISQIEKSPNDSSTVAIMRDLLMYLKDSEMYQLVYLNKSIAKGSITINSNYGPLTDYADIFSDPSDPVVIYKDKESNVRLTGMNTGIVWIGGKGFIVEKKQKILFVMGFK